MDSAISLIALNDVIERFIARSVQSKRRRPDWVRSPSWSVSVRLGTAKLIAVFDAKSSPRHISGSFSQCVLIGLVDEMKERRSKGTGNYWVWCTASSHVDAHLG